MATCPECDAEVEVDDYEVEKGDVVNCYECGASLEVVNVSPLELELVAEDDEEEEEEDELDEDEEDDEEEEDWEE